MHKYLTFTLIAFWGVLGIATAQTTLAHEIGIVFGPSMLKSDYGQRNNSATNFGNSGSGVAFVEYINFSSHSRYNNHFNEHFKIRTELSYNQTKLEHFGRWVEGNNSIGKQQLRAMEGKTSVTTLGTQVEYSLFSETQDFERGYVKFLPYICVGIGYSFYTVKTTSTLGEMGSKEATFPKYLVPSDGHNYGFASESSGCLSLVSGLGTRYKLSEISDLVIEARLQYFNSDWVDGLNPNKTIYTENKYNDWQAWISFGYIYYLH